MSRRIDTSMLEGFLDDIQVQLLLAAETVTQGTIRSVEGEQLSTTMLTDVRAWGTQPCSARSADDRRRGHDVAAASLRTDRPHGQPQAAATEWRAQVSRSPAVALEVGRRTVLEAKATLLDLFAHNEEIVNDEFVPTLLARLAGHVVELSDTIDDLAKHVEPEPEPTVPALLSERIDRTGSRRPRRKGGRK